jgi:cytochrome b involved in lipid metabolism
MSVVPHTVYISLYCMWNLYGNVYDLTDFMDLHPGGRDIIHDTMNKPDITV